MVQDAVLRNLQTLAESTQQDLPGLSVAIDRMARNAQGAGPALSDQRENESVSGERPPGEPTSTPDLER